MELWLVTQDELPVGACWSKVRQFGQGNGALPEVEINAGMEWIWSPRGVAPEGLARAWLEAVAAPPQGMVTDDAGLARLARARGTRVWGAAEWARAREGRGTFSSPVPDGEFSGPGRE